MAVVFIALIAAPVLLNGVGMITSSSIRSVDVLTDGWGQMEARAAEIEQTNIEVLSTSATTQGGGATVDVTVKNSGQRPVLDFGSWDIVVRYQKTNGDDRQLWVPYSATYPPGNDQWAVEGIFRDAATQEAEAFQPNILDPDEEMIIEIKLVPPPMKQVAHNITIGTPNGISVSTTFREN